jgi:hypothetical protein
VKGKFQLVFQHKPPAIDFANNLLFRCFAKKEQKPQLLLLAKLIKNKIAVKHQGNRNVSLAGEDVNNV